MGTYRRILAGSTLFWIAAAAGAAHGFSWPWQVGDPWPGSSERPAETLDHPMVEERAARLDPPPGKGFRFAAFGDQRALADGEWQILMVRVAEEARSDPRLLFMLDTGDIVHRGSHSDQFAMLREILAPAADLPYLVGVGNHEKRNNEDPDARENTALFLAYLDPEFSAGRMYYRKEIGPARFLFLDTSDLVYGDEGETVHPDEFPSGSRAAAQMSWLLKELSTHREGPGPLVVVMHHPFLQTSKKHREHAVWLWNHEHLGRTLADRFLDAGVDLVLSGHTHTYERYSITRDDGAAMEMVNLSGRPRDALLWFGAGSRRARDIAGEEGEWLGKRGWENLDRFTIVQEEAMTGVERNQFALVTIEESGGIVLEMRYLNERDPEETIGTAPVRLR